MVFRILENLKKKSEEGKGIIATQRSLVSAVDSFVRRPSRVTSRAPHIRDAVDLKRFMFVVVFALLPCTLFGIWNTGRSAYLSIGHNGFTFGEAFIEGALHVVPLIILSYAVGGLCEGIFAQVRGHEIAEGFLVTGLLYPLICPPTIPWWMFISGIIFGVIIGKEVFGGTGQNVLNPGLTARAFLFFAYPAAMSGDVWVVKPVKKLADGSLVPASWTTIATSKINAFIQGGVQAVDGFSGATSLLIAEENLPGVDSVANLHNTYSSWEMFIGLMPGSIGETSVLMCLIGSFVLIVTGVGSWRTMSGVVVGALITSILFNLGATDASPTSFGISPIEHLLMGGFAFGAIFMATDPVSGPVHNYSKLIYGFLIGVLCILIRLINPAFPEGMMLSILFMNIFAALIDHYVIKGAQQRRLARAK